MSTDVLVLGAGFGGLELATRLSQALADDVRVTLIDRSSSFMFGFSKLDVLFGHQEYASTRFPYDKIRKPGVEFRQETIVSINGADRHVVTDGGEYDPDILVVALGADYDFAATPGLLEDGFEFYSPEGALRAKDALDAFPGGRAVVAVLGNMFKCPGAPNETALMLDDYLTKKGLRDASSIHLVSPLPMPIPISKKTSEAIARVLADAGIEYWPSSRVVRLDPETHIAHLEDGRTLPYDILLGIPVHCAPPVVADSDLVDNGWIAVDPGTFATKFPGVYAVGDVTSAPVPRAGGIAEGEAATLAAVLIADIRGDEPPPPYDGAASCYVELGNHRVARIDVNFLAYDMPVAKFSAPTAQGALDKKRWGAERAERWFGIPQPS